MGMTRPVVGVFGCLVVDDVIGWGAANDDVIGCGVANIGVNLGATKSATPPKGPGAAKWKKQHFSLFLKIKMVILGLFFFIWFFNRDQ